MRKDRDLDVFARRARELGATAAKPADPARVVTAPWVRLKCRFGCGFHGTRRCCPPGTPAPDETRAVLDCYTRALLIHCAGEGSPSEIVPVLEREVFLAGYYKAFGFCAGPCELCRTCNPKRCAHPEKARPSMEGCGIDVFATARAHGFPIEVLKEYSCAENCFGLVLIE